MKVENPEEKEQRLLEVPRVRPIFLVIISWETGIKQLLSFGHQIPRIRRGEMLYQNKPLKTDHENNLYSL
jgi:hypothetical protein